MPASARSSPTAPSEETGDATGFLPDGDLAANAPHFWRVRAHDGETVSSWSDTQTFRTATAAAPPAPGPIPAPGGGGGPCNSSSALAIVECERNKFGHMNEDQVVAFLRNVVDSLNRNGIEGGRFGLLVKDGRQQLQWILMRHLVFRSRRWSAPVGCPDRFRWFARRNLG